MSPPDDNLDDEDRALIARLRALPTEGDEPSWDRFGRDLDRQLDEIAAPTRPWWRRWWAPAIGVSLAAAAAVAVVMWPPTTTEPTTIATIDHDAEPVPAPIPVPVPAPRPGDTVFALGTEGEIDEVDLDDEDVVAGMLEALDGGEDEAALDDVPEEPIDGLVPDLDLDWVDDLEDEDLDAVTAWLEDEET